MAIVIDATSGGANANSYVTLAEAETYFDTRLYVTAWTEATSDDVKNRALAMACNRINQETFYGTRETDTQRLPFPRIELGYLDGILQDSIVPESLKEAQCELALHLLSTDMSKPSVDTSNIQEVQVGSLKAKYAIDKNDNVSRSYDELPPFVLSLLDDFSRTVNSGGSVTVGR